MKEDEIKQFEANILPNRQYLAKLTELFASPFTKNAN